MFQRLNISIKQKTSSQRGISILIALAFVLICALITAVVLSAASVNAERIKGYRVEQQSYLSKVSALNLVTGIVVGDNTDDADGIQILKTTSGSKDSYSPQGTPDDLGIAQWICKRLSKNPSTTKLTLTIDASSLNSRSDTPLEEVNLELSLDRNGSLLVRAYDGLDGLPDSEGAVANISRTLVPKTKNGVMSWHLSGAAS